MYIRLEPSLTRLFRYLLEAEDNLAYTSVVDRKACVLKVVFAPEQQKQLEQTLQNMRQMIEFARIDFTARAASPGSAADAAPPPAAVF